jgi:hypothetical protein
MTELDALEHALDLARAELSPSLADDTRTRHALGLATSGVASGAAAAAGGGVGRTGLRVTGTSSAVMGALLLGLGFGGGYWVGRGEARVSTAPPALTMAAPGDESRPVAPVEAAWASSPAAALDRLAEESAPGDAFAEPMANAEHDGAPPRRAVAPRAHGKVRPVRKNEHQASRSESPSVPDSAEELALLRRVEKSLRAGDATFALALLAELDERFAKTQLGEEREAANVMARCALAEAGSKLRAALFLRDRAGSVYAERVRSACSVSAE